MGADDELSTSFLLFVTIDTTAGGAARASGTARVTAGVDDDGGSAAALMTTAVCTAAGGIFKGGACTFTGGAGTGIFFAFNIN